MNPSITLFLIVWSTLGTVNNKVGPKYLISSIKVVLTLPEIKPTFAPIPIKPEMTILSKIWAKGKKEICAAYSSTGILPPSMTVSNTDIKFLWDNITPLGFPVVPLV